MTWDYNIRTEHRIEDDQQVTRRVAVAEQGDRTSRHEFRITEDGHEPVGDPSDGAVAALAEWCDEHDQPLGDELAARLADEPEDEPDEGEGDE